MDQKQNAQFDRGPHCLLQRHFKMTSGRHTADISSRNVNIPECSYIASNRKAIVSDVQYEGLFVQQTVRIARLIIPRRTEPKV